MKKQQLLLAGAGIVILALLFFFGKTVTDKKPTPAENGMAKVAPTFNFEEYLEKEKKNLTPSQSNYLGKIENSVSRGAVKAQEIKMYEDLAAFWKDSVRQPELYTFYLGKAAKLVNSEKNLTFAAQLTLSDLRHEQDLVKRGWKAEQAVALFNQALELNPESDSLKLGLGSCYVFGKGMAGDANETMKGIQVLLQLVRKDSMNMQAQLVLGIGGVVSTQYDKAVDRLLRVIKYQPDNVEAVSWLADAYSAKGDKENAIKWYEVSKKMINNPDYSKEVDERIKALKTK
ncbi:MAG: tetratricopeptide repeat protein [Ferruginibacter sp.]